MKIEPAELPDINLCYQMNKSYATEYVWQMQTREQEHSLEIRFDTVRLPRPMRVEYPRNPDELLEHWQADNCFLVIRDPEENVAGFVDAQPQPWLNELWIANLVVDHRYRRQGMAARLLKAAGRWAAAQNLKRITLEMQSKNYPAICFAKKNGFKYCGYNERYYANGDIALFFTRSV
jgi:ribosomal protein S18 acetylase RimI-like enzyme